MTIDMTNAPIEDVLADLDCPLTDDDRLLAAQTIRGLREQLDLINEAASLALAELNEPIVRDRAH